MQEKPRPHAALLALREQHRAAGLDPTHTDVYAVGNPEPWPTPPFAGLTKDGRGRAAQKLLDAGFGA